MNDTLVHRTVDGWDLCSRDGAAWWIRDLELAARAGLAKPRNIRGVIKTMIAEGVLSAEIHSALGEGAVVLAEKTLVPLANGGHQEALEYLLNRKAAVLVAMRLRTERAAELVDGIVTVFLRVVDGGLAGAELQALREDRAALGAELALLKTQMVKLASEVGDVRTQLMLGGGVVSGQQRAQIRSAKRRAARVLVETGLAVSPRSALRSLQNNVHVVTGWGGAGQRDALLPVDLFTRVLAYLEGEAAKGERLLKRRAQLGLPGVPNVFPIAGRKKGSPS